MEWRRNPGLLIAVACFFCSSFSGCSTKPVPAPSPVVQSVSVSPITLALSEGASGMLTATVTADAGVTDRSVVWSSSNNAVATVDQTGRVTAVTPGTATVVVASRADPTKSASVAVTVLIDLTKDLGTFNISATKTTDTGCNFAPSFTGQVQISGNSNGTNLTARMIERLTRIYQTTYSGSGSYSGTGSGNLDGFIYNGTIALATVGGNTIQGTETLNFTSGCPGRQVIYQFTGSK